MIQKVNQTMVFKIIQNHKLLRDSANFSQSQSIESYRTSQYSAVSPLTLWSMGFITLN